jgi:hypothetical protein
MRASISDFPNFPQAFGFSAFGFSEMTQIGQALGATFCRSLGVTFAPYLGCFLGFLQVTSRLSSPKASALDGFPLRVL